MEINELMVGDWVSYKKVCSRIASADFDLNNRTWMQEIEPIPLTTEMLEKNGWEECNWDTDDDVQYGYDYGLFYFTWWRNVELLSCYFEDKNAGLSYEMISEMPIKYVHQLQHALRLCGIDKEIEL